MFTCSICCVLYDYRATNSGSTVGMISMFNTVIQRERFTSLWKGISPVSCTITLHHLYLTARHLCCNTCTSVIIDHALFVFLTPNCKKSLQRCVPSVGVYFASVHFLKTTIGYESSSRNILFACILCSIMLTKWWVECVVCVCV